MKPYPSGQGEQDETVALLSRPDTYGVDAVEIVETHISRVFLAGDRAYKLKKAVRFSYLDYSTPELRLAACRAELAVNRCFAPGLYLRVAPVTRRPDGALALGGEGPAADWVLVMRRFDQQLQLDRVAERGGLTPALARMLADRIAEVHAGAETRFEHGGASGLRRALDVTVENLRLAATAGPDTGATLDRAAVEEWAAQARRALQGNAELLDSRRLAGRVRACHGDLHLRNICVLDGRPTPFDAIEFDPALSCIDVLYDLAFLLMDLHGRGFGPAANAVFNRYLDLRDEVDGLQALPLFMSLRAAIRAQVTAAACRSRPGPAVADVEVRAAEAARYLALAHELLAAAPARLVAIGGLSGSGKTTLAYRLAPTLGRPPGARVVRSDVLRKRAAGLAPEARLPPDAYTAASRAAVYGALEAEARLCLTAGQAVVADAVFGGGAERSAIEGVARSCAVPFDGLWLEAPLDVLAARVAARTGDASDATPEVVRAQHAALDGPGSAAAGWRVIAAAGDAAATERAARAALGEQGVGARSSLSANGKTGRARSLGWWAARSGSRPRRR